MSWGQWVTLCRVTTLVILVAAFLWDVRRALK
jgi:hypothetical protein